MPPLCSPVLYPDGHYGWLALMDDIGLAYVPAFGARSTRLPWDGRHMPLRWRLLLMYRDHYGCSWRECGRLLGVSGAAAHGAYQRWKPLECCPPAHHLTDDPPVLSAAAS